MGDMADFFADWYDPNGYKQCVYESFIEAESGFWRDKQGKLHRISAMDTGHLINVTRMLERNNIAVPEAIELELEFRGTHGS